MIKVLLLQQLQHPLFEAMAEMYKASKKLALRWKNTLEPPIEKKQLRKEQFTIQVGLKYFAVI